MFYLVGIFRTSLLAQIIIKFLGWEDPLEKEMATHSSPLARKIPWIDGGAS